MRDGEVLSTMVWRGQRHSGQLGGWTRERHMDGMGDGKRGHFPDESVTCH